MLGAFIHELGCQHSCQFSDCLGVRPQSLEIRGIAIQRELLTGVAAH